MIELWGRKNAYNVQKVLWTLGELNIDYVHHDVGSEPGDLDTAEFIKLNPHARIPVLVDDHRAIWESNTIVRYLSATCGENTLWPASPLQRSYAERWMDWELATLQPDFLALFWGFYRTPETERDVEKIRHSQARCLQHLNKLDKHLVNQEYLAGAAFTMGDIACGTCLYRYFEMGLKVDTPAYVLDWYKRLSQREAFQNTIMVPFDELKGRRTY